MPLNPAGYLHQKRHQAMSLARLDGEEENEYLSAQPIKKQELASRRKTSPEPDGSAKAWGLSDVGVVLQVGKEQGVS